MIGWLVDRFLYNEPSRSELKEQARLKFIEEFYEEQRQRAAQRRQPGLSSQMAQIRPLSPEAIALGKKPYLGPKRSRPSKRKKS